MKNVTILIILAVFIAVGLGFSQTDQQIDQQVNRAQATYDSALASYKVDIYKYIDDLQGHEKISDFRMNKIRKKAKHFFKEKTKFDEYLACNRLPITTVHLDTIFVDALYSYNNFAGAVYKDGEGKLSVYFSNRFGHKVEVGAIIEQFIKVILVIILAVIVGLIVGAAKDEDTGWYCGIIIFIIGIPISFIPF